MKIFISYPPYESEKGIACLTQNRQFQWFNNPSYIPPVVPMTAATLLKKKGHNVVWNDAIAEEWSYQRFLDNLREAKPDLWVTEVKTPVVKPAWDIVADVKKASPQTKVILMGDHVTALPEESFENSKVDYVIIGGDYDFLLANLVDSLSGEDINRKKLSSCIMFRDNDGSLQKGTANIKYKLDDAPFIDRDLTKWTLYQQHWFRRTPGTYVMSARDCWWGKCTFCAWTTLYPQYRVRTPENVLDEIGELIGKYGVKEIMDDAGTIPVGNWLKTFCEGMIERGYNRKVKMNCNMRAGALKDQEEYDLMAKAGFKLLLYGVESVNKETLQRIDKGRTDPYDIVRDCRMAKKAGLKPHLTVMMGYPWETKKDAQKTFDFIKKIMVRGLADSLQATIVVPYPGTSLFDECQKNDWLITEDWDRYDMRESVMKSEVSNESILKFTHDMYSAVATNPKFLYHQITSMKDFYDFLYLAKVARQMMFGKFRDFGKENAAKEKDE
ncbi:B12-binding domain-containing radical SAM protein [Patescibacteria group bacterium]